MWHKKKSKDKTTTKFANVWLKFANVCPHAARFLKKKRKKKKAEFSYVQDGGMPDENDEMVAHFNF